MVEKQGLEMRRRESLGLGDAGPCKLAITLLIFTLSTVKEGFMLGSDKIRLTGKNSILNIDIAHYVPVF